MKKAYIVGYIPRGMNRQQPVLSEAHDKVNGIPVASIRAQATRYTNQHHQLTHHLHGLTATGVHDTDDTPLATAHNPA